MNRLQVLLTAEQQRRLKNLARRRGVSISALIREGVGRLIEAETQAVNERWARASAVIGAFHGPPGDVAKHHDEWFAGATAAKSCERRPLERPSA